MRAGMKNVHFPKGNMGILAFSVLRIITFSSQTIFLYTDPGYFLIFAQFTRPFA